MMKKRPGNDEIFHNVLKYWEEKDFRSKDVSDILATRFYSQLNMLSKKNKWGKLLYIPFHFLATRYSNFLRNTFSLNSNNKYPQAHALLIRALISRYKLSREESLKKLVYKLSDEILELRNKNFENFCWGQPYNWPSKSLMKANVPRTTVTSQVAAAFLDIYEFLEDEVFLDYAKKICDFYIQDLNYKEDFDGDFCFSYTTEDHYHIHNPSILAASILFRTSYFTAIDKYLEYGTKAANFTAKHQNKDGSWYYRSKPDTVKKMIDNYHTGFVLEGFKEIETYSKEDFLYKEEIDKGIRFYKNHFFTNKFEPKFRPNKLYPIDIQSCAQSIITLKMFEDHECISKNFIEGVTNYSIEHFYDEKGHFYFRYYNDKKIDKNAFLRWGDAWMLRALSL